jgi:AcrR family transcriptional regulator
METRRPHQREPRPWSQDPTRHRICAAATEAFLSRSYAGATMEEIAAIAGTDVATVYANFRTKSMSLHVCHEGRGEAPFAMEVAGDLLENFVNGWSCRAVTPRKGEC